MALVLDADDRPIRVVWMTKGERAAAAAPIGEIVQAVAATEGAASVWLSHNHPSSIPTPSEADQQVQYRFWSAMQALGTIRVNGHIVIGGNRYGQTDPEGQAPDPWNNEEPIPRANRAKGVSVPVVERVFAGVARPLGSAIDRVFGRPAGSTDVPLKAITSPWQLKRVAKQIGEPGVIILDNRHTPVGFVRIADADMARLRGARAVEIAKAFDEANGMAAMILTKSSDPATDGVKNLVRLLNQSLRVGVLDAVSFRNGTLTSEIGVDLQRDEHLKTVTEESPAYGSGAQTIDVEGTQRPTTNSTGRPIHPTEEGVRNFWRWFGDSKVVDDQGRPLVVYHGTFGDFNQFDDAKLGENTDDNASSREYAETARVGFWFNTNPMGSSSAGYTVDMPVYLKIEDLRREMSLDWLAQGLEETDGRAYRDDLIAQGYDGIVLRDEEFGGTSYIAFRPEQIKSATGNTGEFSRDDPSTVREDELLSTYTQAELEYRDAARREYEAAQARQAAADRRKAQADADRNDFRLTGSDRSADVAMAGGQQDLGLDRPAPKARTGARTAPDDFKLREDGPQYTAVKLVKGTPEHKSAEKAMQERQRRWDTFDEYYEAARQAHYALQDAIAEVAEEIGAQQHRRPGGEPKEYASAFEKITRKNYGGYWGLTDVAATMLIVDTPAHARRALDALRSRYETVLDEGFNATHLGYFDNKVLVQGADGVIGEVILIPRAMYEGRTVEGGHDLYDQIEKVHDKDPAEVERLSRLSIDLYKRKLKEAGAEWADAVDRVPGPELDLWGVARMLQEVRAGNPRNRAYSSRESETASPVNSKSRRNSRMATSPQVDPSSLDTNARLSDADITAGRASQAKNDKSGAPRSSGGTGTSSGVDDFTSKSVDQNPGPRPGRSARFGGNQGGFVDPSASQPVVMGYEALKKAFVDYVGDPLLPITEALTGRVVGRAGPERLDLELPTPRRTGGGVQNRRHRRSGAEGDWVSSGPWANAYIHRRAAVQ